MGIIDLIKKITDTSADSPIRIQNDERLARKNPGTEWSTHKYLAFLHMPRVS